MNYNQREDPPGKKTNKNIDKSQSENEPNINLNGEEMELNNANATKRTHRKTTWGK